MSKSTAFAAALSLALPLLVAAPASADTVSTQQFVNKAAMSDMFEIKAGGLAAKKAKHEDIKDFGEEMVEDHTENSKDLKELVKDEEIKATLPTALDEAHKAKLDKLNSTSGAAFDKTYVPMQVLAHEAAVNMFESYAKSGDNEALKEWAGDTLPALKEHLKEARTLSTEISKTAEADDAEPMATAMDETKAKDNKAKDDKAMDETVTDETVTDETVKDADAKKPAPPAFKYVTRQAPTDWTAQALIDKTVHNTRNENLGEINNVILNEKGKVVAVTIGVGGFLGLGEKDVGVPFDALKFRTEEAMEKKAEADSDDEKTGDAESTNDTAMDDDADHSDMVIVLDATKEQLAAAPTFKWLGDRTEKRDETETGKTVE